MTIYDAVIEKEATLFPLKGQVSDVITVAKRDLKKGEKLEGMGSRQIFGTLTSHEIQQKEGYLPIALVGKNTYVTKDIKKDSLIKLSDVVLEDDSLIVKLRKEQDRLGL